jgi:uncharacterized membrane protein YbaN (DUF454 family)
MQTDTPSPSFDNASTKLIAAGVIVVCLLLGFAGLILPLIPGLLFLAIAAIVAAKLSPRFAETLRQNETLRGYLDRTEGIENLALGDKIKVGGLLFVKALIDGVAFLVASVMKLLKAVERV